MAAAARRGISRGWLVSLAVSVALLVAACWAGLAFRIAEAADRCLAMEGSVWADDGCRHLMAYPLAVAVVSLLLMLSLCLQEARADAKVRAAKLAGEGLPDAIFVRELGFALVAMGIIYLFSFVVMILCLVVQNAGSRRLLRDKADKGGHAMVDAGTIITNVGCVSVWVECCCVIFPYLMLRLRRFVRANWNGGLDIGALPLDAWITRDFGGMMSCNHPIPLRRVGFQESCCVKEPHEAIFFGSLPSATLQRVICFPATTFWSQYLNVSGLRSSTWPPTLIYSLLSNVDSKLITM